MNGEHAAGIIKLIKSGLTFEPCQLPPDFDWDECRRISAAHQITPLIYYGIYYSKPSIPDGISQKFKQSFLNMSVKSEQQAYDINRLLSALQDGKIDHMPLKGIVLKPLYPHPALRIMSDGDILIRLEQYDKIQGIMTGLGYTPGVESDHELVWNRASEIIELHKRLIPSYNKDYYAYYSDGWRLALRDGENSYRYHLSENDELIYLFTHFSKHYRDGGIGIRHIVDLYVFIAHYSDLDGDYIKTELTKLQLYDFYVNIRHTIDVWFNDGTPDDITDFITKHIFESDSYGTEQSKLLASAVKESKNTADKTVRTHRFIRLVFLPYKNMTQLYPTLIKLPFLLPFFWCVRIIDRVINKRGNIKKEADNLNLLSADNIEKYQSELNFVGLDFNFKE